MSRGSAGGVSISSTVPASPAVTVPKTNATRVPDEEWEAQKDTLHRLYIDENRTLNDIISYMQNEQHFHAGKRQYVHRFRKWGWKKYGNSTFERSNQAFHSSGRGEEDEDEGDEPVPAPQKLVQESRTQRAPTAARDKARAEGSKTLASFSSHNYRALAPQHRDKFPRPLTLQEKAPVTMRAEPALITSSRGHQVVDQAEFTHAPKASGQGSLLEASRVARRARKSTEDDIGEDTEEEEELRRTKRLKSRRTNLNFACPFRKRNPQRFNVRDHGTCALNSFSDFALLKRHIKTFHQRARGPVTCIRCKEQFPDQAALRHHLIQPKSCSLKITDRQDDPEDGITDEVERTLKARSRYDHISSWQDLWMCLFPEDDVDMIPGPEFEPVTESHQLEHYLLGRTQDLAQVLRSDLHAHGFPIDVSVDIESFLGLALLEAVQDFRRENLQEVSRLWRKEMDTYLLNFSEDRHNLMPQTSSDVFQTFFG